jgi:hypothetical protein
MFVAISTWTLILIFFLILTKRGDGQEEAVFRRKVGKYLANYVIRTENTTSEMECGIHCSADSVCASVNYKTSGTDKGLCELNSKALDERESHMLLSDSTDFIYLHIDIRVRKCIFYKCSRILYLFSFILY